MQRKLGAAVAALAIIIVGTLPALADTTPEDALDNRKAVMTALRGHIGAASMIAMFPITVPLVAFLTIRNRKS